MADLTGIENVGDFFSQHYLTELLEKDLSSESEDLAKAIEAVQKALPPLGRELNKVLTEAPLHTAPRHLAQVARPFHVLLCEALGFAYQSGAVLPLGDGSAVPALHLTERQGDVYLAVLEGRLRSPDDALLDLLWTHPLPASARSVGTSSPSGGRAREEGLEPPRDTTLGEVIAHAFEVETPPRWILLLSGAEVVLAERARWGRGQYLRFDLAEILGRKDPRALRITAALLARASLVPDGGALLHDRLDESSHKHAQGVSADLKFAAREAVELLANEWVHYQRTTAKKALHGERVARELTEECLIYLYRLLVLFYVEARSGELELLPMNSEEYARGYSLETLRDLEQVTLGPESREGFFFDESLRHLFRLVNEGFSGTGQLTLAARPAAVQAGSTAAGSSENGNPERDIKDQRGFRIEGLHSPLFDPRSTPRLSRVRLRNEVLQRIVRLLSLTPEAQRGRGAKLWGRGRISYAQLGINQLGSVYEGLLSYTGFFARERLYEVHRAGDGEKDATQQAWFVPEKDLVRYTDDELSFLDPATGQKKRRKYEPGTFIYRLAGRDRESSASYYTPEVLTRCLVKYALRELLAGKSAEDILGLTICEPAMGSGAFLVEAVDQLADAYLERRRKEVGGIALPPNEYAAEKQKVKSYLAEARCYGVDLNPMAARLAGVSLWLSTLHKGQRTPWYGARLAVGNSLVGARLEVWAAGDFQTDEGLSKAISTTLKKHGDSDELESHLAMVLAAHEAKHPEAVADVRSRVERVKRLAGAGSEGEEGSEEAESEASEAEQAAAQRKEVVKALKKLASELKLPRHHRRPPRKVEARAVIAGERPAGSVWHFLVPDAGMSPFEADKVVAELAPDAVKRIKEWRKDVEEPWSPVDVSRLVVLSDRVDALYREYAEDRRRVLDRCTPVADVWGMETRAGVLPPLEQREAMLKALRAEGTAFSRLERVMSLWAALWAFPIEHASLLPKREAWLRALESELGVETPARPPEPGQLSIWQEVAEDEGSDEEGEGAEEEKGVVTLWRAAAESCSRTRPLHWELAFPEVFVEGGGFDLVVGNPPWLKVQWNEQRMLEDMDPRIALDGLSASDASKRRKDVLSTKERGRELLTGLSLTDGTKAFLTSTAYYPLLGSMQANLYKCFIVHGWRIGAPTGSVALIHQDGLFDDPKGGLLRAELYLRLRLVLRFKNEMMLFADVGHVRPYVCTVMSAARQATVNFEVISNLFHPSTVEAAYGHDGQGVVSGIKSDSDHFEVRGHRRRIVSVTESELVTFAQLFDKGEIRWAEARLPILHSREVVDVLEKVVLHPGRLADTETTILMTEMWHETGAQRDGTIRRETRFPDSVDDWIMSGPHLYVGNPFSKTPREVCNTKNAYDTIDLEAIPEDYLPRTNFVRACAAAEYVSRLPMFQGKPITSCYRHVNRRMVAITGERTVVAAMAPPGVGHTDLVFSVAFESAISMVEWNAFLCSLPIDFLVRTIGKGDLRKSTALSLPRPQGAAAPKLATRALRLNCLTTHYADLWNEVWPQVASAPAWSLSDPRLSPWPSPTATWHRHAALRNHFERRWALVEIDALAALELKLTIDELCTIYRTQFPVLREYEKNTWYDRNGRIAFTVNRGLTGVGLERKAFELWQACLKENKPLPPDFDRQSLEPPFDVRDREADMRTAYTFFARTLALPPPPPPS